MSYSSYCLIADVFNKLPVELADPTDDRDKVLPLLKNQCKWDFLSHSLQATIREQNKSLTHPIDNSSPPPPSRVPLVTGGTASKNDSTDLLATPIPQRLIFALSLLVFSVVADGGNTTRPPDLAAPADLQMKMVHSTL